MKIIKRLITLSVLALSISGVAEAACVKSHVCDDYGNNCRVRDICNSTMDLPSIGIAPIKPLPSLGVKPLPSLSVPPIGTTKCQYRQVNGRWQNVCY